MNDDYLWDKSGQPDPEVRQLEEILGTLRYQPRPLQLPDDLPMPRRRNYFPVLAIAAAVLLALIAGALWLKVRTVSQSEPQQAHFEVVPPVEKAGPMNNENVVPPKKVAPREESVAVNKKHRHRSSANVLATREREEALAAKEQVMLALRLASEKLNLVHRRTQSTPPLNQIKNQHRVG
jgi:hypothetical protein